MQIEWKKPNAAIIGAKPSLQFEMIAALIKSGCKRIVIVGRDGA